MWTRRLSALVVEKVMEMLFVSAVIARHGEVVAPDVVQSAAVELTVVGHLEDVPRPPLDLTAVLAGGVGVAWEGLDCEGDCPPHRGVVVLVLHHHGQRVAGLLGRAAPVPDGDLHLEL